MGQAKYLICKACTSANTESICKTFSKQSTYAAKACTLHLVLPSLPASHPIPTSYIYIYMYTHICVYIYIYVIHHYPLVLCPSHSHGQSPFRVHAVPSGICLCERVLWATKSHSCSFRHGIGSGKRLGQLALPRVLELCESLSLSLFLSLILAALYLSHCLARMVSPLAGFTRYPQGFAYARAFSGPPDATHTPLSVGLRVESGSDSCLFQESRSSVSPSTCCVTLCVSS